MKNECGLKEMSLTTCNARQLKGEFGRMNSEKEVVAAAADNNRKKDAHHGTHFEFASSHFAALVELRTFMASKRDELFCARR